MKQWVYLICSMDLLPQVAGWLGGQVASLPAGPAGRRPSVNVDQSLNGHCGPGGWVARQLGGQAAGWPGGWVAMVGQVTGWPGGWVARFARTCIQMHISFIHLHFLFKSRFVRCDALVEEWLGCAGITS